MSSAGFSCAADSQDPAFVTTQQRQGQPHVEPQLDVDGHDTNSQNGAVIPETYDLVLRQSRPRSWNPIAPPPQQHQVQPQHVPEELVAALQQYFTRSLISQKQSDYDVLANNTSLTALVEQLTDTELMAFGESLRDDLRVTFFDRLIEESPQIQPWVEAYFECRQHMLER